MMQERMAGTEKPHRAGLGVGATPEGPGDPGIEPERSPRRAIDHEEKAGNPDHVHRAPSLSNPGAPYRDTGRRAEAVSLHQRAIAIVEVSLPPDHPHIAAVRTNYAVLLASLGRSGQSAAPPD
jgi:hypothetical protein